MLDGLQAIRKPAGPNVILSWTKTSSDGYSPEPSRRQCGFFATEAGDQAIMGQVPYKGPSYVNGITGISNAFGGDH